MAAPFRCAAGDRQCVNHEALAGSGPVKHSGAVRYVRQQSPAEWKRNGSPSANVVAVQSDIMYELYSYSIYFLQIRSKYGTGAKTNVRK